MHGWRETRVALGALMVAGMLGAAPVPAPAPAPAPESVKAEARTKFENGQPINDFFTALAVKFEVMVVQAKPVDAFVLKDFEMPAKLEDALAIARQTLEPQGYSVMQSLADKRLVVRILPTGDYKKLEVSESPVSYGTGGEKIDISNPNRQVTHMLPVNHFEMLETLRRTGKQDPDVSVEIAGGGTIGVDLIFTGPALKVQRAVEAVAKLDKTVGGATIARTLALKHLDAQVTADALNAGFSQDGAPMKAVVDLRTNSIVITGPEAQVLQIMVELIGQEAKRGPVLPRPDVPPPPTLPPLPPASSAPAGERPGVQGEKRPSALDEMGNGGDNGAPRRVALFSPVGANFSLIVNEAVFL